jgi:polar amino acid transport system permease protein
MRYVVLPQAVRRVLPPLLNDVVSLTKDSSLIVVLGIPIDATRSAQIVTSQTFNFTPYVVAGLLFLALTIPMTRFTDWVSARYGYSPARGHL